MAMSIAAVAACVFGLVSCAPAAISQTPIVDSADQALSVEAPSRMSYIVNFRPSHALGQAQILQNAGRYDEAEQLVVVTLRDNIALRGLCFERFTVGGAEIVLNVCAPDPFEDPLVTQDRWLEQLGATMGVAYVERNLVAQHEDASEAGPS
ncbi:MAG: hypothetical protein AB7F85_09020 [Hyphomonadaceae bacterium]